VFAPSLVECHGFSEAEAGSRVFVEFGLLCICEILRLFDIIGSCSLQRFGVMSLTTKTLFRFFCLSLVSVRNDLGLPFVRFALLSDDSFFFLTFFLGSFSISSDAGLFLSSSLLCKMCFLSLGAFILLSLRFGRFLAQYVNPLILKARLLLRYSSLAFESPCLAARFVSFFGFPYSHFVMIYFPGGSDYRMIFVVSDPLFENS
jgi:hypothetical protein